MEESGVTEHTKTPWAVDEYLEIGPIRQSDDHPLGKVLPVADVYGDNMHEDAYFIVKCVNSHERLRAERNTLKEFKDYYQGLLKGCGFDGITDLMSSYRRAQSQNERLVEMVNALLLNPGDALVSHMARDLLQELESKP